MKKAITLALVFVLALSLLTACGSNDNGGTGSTGGNNSTPSASQGVNNNGGGTAVKDITADNWTTVVKDNYGLDLTMPDGWEVTEAYSPNEVDNVKVLYKTGGTTTGEDQAKAMFAACQAAGTVNVASFDEAVTSKGISTWQYTRNGTTKTINAYFDVDGSFEITIS
jgi:predicted small secreted protein